MRSFFSIGLCLWAYGVFSQSADTTYLNEVTVYGLPVVAYTTGSKVETIASGDQVSTLADGLAGDASLYLKNYGNNQLSTIAFRGTTAWQTAVLWNGVNINSPTLGQTDFSLIPLFLFDEASLHYGTASSLYGSDAIGGSVMLGQSAPVFKKNASLSLYQQLASFGKWATGMKAAFGNKHWQWKTKVYRSSIRNDFPYTSPAVGHRQRQVHAAVTNYGVDQQLHFKISGTQTLAAEVMYTNNFRENQPAVTNLDADETLQDGSLRAAVNYHNNTAWGDLHGTAAYVRNVEHFTNDETTSTITNQVVGTVQAHTAIGYRSDLRGGLSYNYYNALSRNFANAGEHRYDAFASCRLAVSNRWIVNINARQSVYANRYAPFSPSLGSELYLKRQEANSLMLRAQVARGFRVPTLNDRFYMPGGNPLTQPEDALHAESGMVWNREIQRARISLEGTYYRSWIDRMIVWLPDAEGVWSAGNLQAAHIQGAEFSSKVEAHIHQTQFRLAAGYGFTQSLNKKGLTPGDPGNTQLPYVPLHSARVTGSCSTKNNWHVNIHVSFTGQRYSTLDNTEYQSLDPYTLIDLAVSRKYPYREFLFEARAEIRNATNIYYETLKHHAMPGRNYSLSLFIHFKSNQHEQN